MKNKAVSILSKALIKVGKPFDGNVSPGGFYKPRKIK